MTGGNDPALPDTTRDELHELAWVLARQRLQLGPDQPPFSPHDADTPQQRRTVWLAIVAAVDDLRIEAEEWSKVAAYAAAKAGADYGDLGDAVGITRQGARKRWPGLGDVTRAARDCEPADAGGLADRGQAATDRPAIPGNAGRGAR